MLTAALLDLDGTLLDSNDLHVRAWGSALREHGYNVAADRIGIELGKGSEQLVPDLLGESAEHQHGKALREAHDVAFTKLAESEGLQPQDGALDLMKALRAAGLRLALATSTSAKMLEVSERASKIAWRALFDEVIDASEVKRSKPAPDIVAAAVHKLGVSPAECVMFGDTPWDAKSAKHAGVLLVGVTCGGNDEATLLRAGSRIVRASPAAVARELAEVLQRVSPGRVRLDHALLDALMQQALAAAQRALDDGEAPIGAVLARGDGTLISGGWNRFNRTGDRTAHAEIDAFRAAGDALDPDARDTILVSTLEPCVMCLGAAMELAIDTVVYGLRAPADAGTSRVDPPQSPDNQMPRIVGDVRAAESRALFERWLATPGHNPAQEPFVCGLLR